MQKIVPDDSILIPDGAKRVFEGKIFDTYQWEQKLYDGSTATFEMLKRPDTVEVIVVRGGEVLLVQDEQPNRQLRVDFPGGRVDPGEDWLQAAQRELREETGLECKSWKLIEVHQPLDKLEWFVALYVATDIVSEHEPEPGPGEKIGLQWQDYEELREAALGHDKGLHVSYLLEFFGRNWTTSDILALPEFTGKTVDR